MIDFNSLPYAEWLEEANKALVELNPDAIYFGLVKNGEVISSFYNVGDAERALIPQEILLLSIIERTEDRVRGLMEDIYNEMREDDEEEEEECEDT